MQSRARGFRGVVAVALTTGVFGVAAEESFTIPLVVDFENPQYENFHAYVARGLNALVGDGALIAESTNSPGSCRIATSTLSGDGVSATFADVIVELAADQEDSELLTGAGLMIRYSAEAGLTRFLGILMREQEYLVFSFQNGDVAQTLRGSVSVDAGSPVRLSAREIDRGAEFFVGSRPVGSLSETGISGAGLGLIHCGSGRFRFDNWGLNTKGDVGFDAAPSGAGPADLLEFGQDPAVVPDKPTPSSVPSPPPLPAAEWWVAEEGQPSGPITLPELRARVTEGRITPETLVWREGMADWAPVSEALP